MIKKIKVLLCYHRFMCRKWTPISRTAQPYRLTFSNCTAFLVTRNCGGSMARARKSAIGVLAGARSFVWRHSSCTPYTYVNLNRISEAIQTWKQNTNYSQK